jgi:predicted nucleic acid-binding protein
LNLIDTDILIWYLRGHEKARDLIEKQDGFAISVITYMELIQGMRNKQELSYLRNAFRVWNVTVIYLNEEISTKALLYIEQLLLSHSVRLADALIGATSVTTGMPLFTANVKHYTVMNTVNLRTFKP